MRQLEAMRFTIDRAREWDYDPYLPDLDRKIVKGALTLDHFEDMYERAAGGDYSEGKLGRHLGYIQGVLVALGYCSLDELKEINKRFA